MTRQRRGWRALITMVWLVPAVHVAVRVFDYRTTREWLGRRAEARRGALVTPSTDLATWQLATARVTRYSLLPGNCLSRSLALEYVLRAHGHDAQLHLGVSRADGIFAAHAWVTHGDTVLNDTQDVASRYVPFTRRPLPPRH
jgi:hypothetical protein